jgi:hypothetical protein
MLPPNSKMPKTDKIIFFNISNSSSNNVLNQSSNEKPFQMDFRYSQSTSSPNISVSDSTPANLQDKPVLTVQDNVKIPAIKFLIDPQVSYQFQNQITLASEISRCKPNATAIKFANIKDNVVLIATDDSQTYSYLTSSWPDDAFVKGVKVLPVKIQQQQFEVILKGVHPTVPIDDYLINSLQNQGLQSPKRIINRNTNQPTYLIKASAIDKQTFDKVTNGFVFIAYSRIRVEPSKTVNQCFKCQEVGHHQSKCNNTSRCLKCGLNHHHSKCVADVPKCSNCGGEHVACSRKCPYLQSNKPQTITSASNSIKPTSRAPSTSYANYANALNANIAKDKKEIVNNFVTDTKDKIMEDIKQEIHKCISQAAKKICEAFAEVLFLDNDKSDPQQLKYNITVCQKIIQDHLNVMIDPSLVSNRIVSKAWKSGLNINQLSSIPSNKNV